MAPADRLVRPALGLIPATIVAVGVTIALQTNAWTVWGVAPMEPKAGGSTSFADLANITATAACMDRGWDYTACDPYGRLFQPYVVLPARALAALGIGMDSTTALGVALSVAFVLGVAVLGLRMAARWPGTTAGLAIAAVILGLAGVGPPTMLAVERGQIELLTFLLACVGLALLPSTSRPARVVGAVAAVAAVVTKFVALGALAPVAQRRRPTTAAVIALGLSIAFCLALLPDLVQASRAARTSEPGTTRTQLGAVTLPATWLTGDPVGNIPDESVVGRWGLLLAVSALVTVVGVVVAALLLRPERTQPLDRDPVARWLVLGGTGTLLPVYVLGLAHDYRLVFALPILAGLSRWSAAAAGPGRALPLVLGACTVVAILTGAAMVAAPNGFWLPRAGLIVGDLALFVTLVAGGGLWLRGVIRRAT